MRASRRTVVVLLLGVALAVAPAALSASSSRGQAPRPMLGALDQAWQLVVEWFGGVRVDAGATPDPNGKANHARIHPAAGRPSPAVRPDNGATPDPNGG
jgi:hypothetical protein